MWTFTLDEEFSLERWHSSRPRSTCSWSPMITKRLPDLHLPSYNKKVTSYKCSLGSFSLHFPKYFGWRAVPGANGHIGLGTEKVTPMSCNLLDGYLSPKQFLTLPHNYSHCWQLGSLGILEGVMSQNQCRMPLIRTAAGSLKRFMTCLRI